jgi:cell wall-associated NlpC family hydrolase
MTSQHVIPDAGASAALRDKGVPCEVVVEVATGWTAPDAPRAIDAAAIADEPDLASWLKILDEHGPEARLDLHTRTLTQFLRGEPVDVIDEAGDWLRVVAPWQPSPDDARGYPAWVRRAHVAPRAAVPVDAPPAIAPANRDAILQRARRHLGLAYLWGGTSAYGLDCSGLIHTGYREAGVIVPRDAHAQYLVAERVPLGEEQAGDLYFFARENRHVYHVGIVTEPGRMLHAPESGRHIEETELAPARRETLVAAGRIPV